MSQSKGLTLAELDAESGEELPKRELMGCISVLVVTPGALNIAPQFAAVCVNAS